MSDSAARRGAVRRVRGQVLLPQGDLPEQAAQVIVRVEDTSRADAPSDVVAEQRFSEVHLAGSRSLPFEIEVPEELMDEKATYTVAAHVDLSGSGEVEKGDLISTQSHPVLTHGYPSEVAVPVKRI